jgi:nitroreductase
MELFEAIHTRASNGHVKPDPVPRELIETMLAAAAQAPNHHKVRPWRFVVVTGAGLERLGDVCADVLRKKKPDAPPEALVAERGKALRSPLLIIIGVDKPNGPKVLEIENVAAAACATQNLLLAAQALGLAAKWRTGSLALDPEVKAFCGFEPDQHLLGFIHIGYPANEATVVGRPGAEDRTVWVG